jgi:chorismate mutase
MAINCGPKAPQLEINTIAARLEGLEETIISKLIDRAQFCTNKRVYRPGESGFMGEKQRSLFHLRLLFHEQMDAQFGRFCVPEERPFFSRLPKVKRKARIPFTGLCLSDYNDINLMPAIVKRYLDFIPRICRSGDDGHYGSSVEHDVYAVQAIARRVHYGSLYVAESKFRAEPASFKELIRKDDEKAIIAKLTRRDVEEKIVRRIREKVKTMQSRVNKNVRYCIDPSVVAEFYRNVIVPLTKKGEVLYLINRDRN